MLGLRSVISRMRRAPRAAVPFDRPRIRARRFSTALRLPQALQCAAGALEMLMQGDLTIGECEARRQSLVESNCATCPNPPAKFLPFSQSDEENVKTLYALAVALGSFSMYTPVFNSDISNLALQAAYHAACRTFCVFTIARYLIIFLYRRKYFSSFLLARSVLRCKTRKHHGARLSVPCECKPVDSPYLHIL